MLVRITKLELLTSFDVDSFLVKFFQAKADAPTGL